MLNKTLDNKFTLIFAIQWKWMASGNSLKQKNQMTSGVTRFDWPYLKRGEYEWDLRSVEMIISEWLKFLSFHTKIYWMASKDLEYNTKLYGLLWRCFYHIWSFTVPGHRPLSLYGKHSAEKFLFLCFMTRGSVNQFWVNYPFKTFLEPERVFFFLELQVRGVKQKLLRNSETLR